MTDQLQIYNGALRILKERKLATLAENREPRRLLDDVWSDNYLGTVLEQASWVFATRSVKADYSPSVEPPFGLQYAFDKPSDWVRTVGISSDDRFRQPLLAVQDEAGFWFADIQTIYVRFVSSANNYGGDFSLWPFSFVRYVEHYFAWQIAPRLLKTDNDAKEVERKMNKALAEAKGKDALNDGAQALPAGSWTRSRFGRSASQSLWDGRWR